MSGESLSPGLIARLDQLKAATGAVIYIPIDRSYADVKHARIPPAELAVVLRQLADQLDARARGESHD